MMFVHGDTWTPRQAAASLNKRPKGERRGGFLEAAVGNVNVIRRIYANTVHNSTLSIQSQKGRYCYTLVQ